MKRLLTLDDLYNLYANKAASAHYSSSESDGNIVVQVQGKIKFEKDKATEGLLPVILKSCHTQSNINGSNISDESMTAALPSFSNRPILGYIHEVDGQYEFYGHNMHQDDDGNVVYDEVPVGIIPESCEAKLEYDEEKGKTYVVVKGYIFEEYSKAAEILLREEECNVSVELSIRELSYDAKEKLLNIEDFYFSGVTILGKDENGTVVKPGMQGSNIKLSDFSEKKNSFTIDVDVDTTKLDLLIKKLDQANERISNLNNIEPNFEEGGNVSVKLEEMLEKYGKTTEDLDFDYENMSDEELETKFEELFGEQEKGKGSEDFGCNKKKKCSIEVNGKEYTFEISLDDKCRALEALVNDSYAEQDNAYYAVKVYDSYVVMIDYWTGRAFKQYYKSEEDVYSLTGDRVEVYCTYLTKDEEATIDEMRSKYEEVVNKLAEYEVKELIAEKEAVFADENCDCIRESEEFKALVDNSAKYSVDEIKAKCKDMLFEYAKTKGTFASTTQKRQVRVGAQKEETYSPYGSLFSK